MNLSKMLEKELLEGRFWTHSTTLVDGCSPISEGCCNCWLSQIRHRFGGVDSKGSPIITGSDGLFTGAIELHPERLADILPKSAHRKPRVWTYWSDLFHAGVPDDFRDEFFRLIGVGWDKHIICTKRPDVAVKYFSEPWRQGKENGSAILMITMENQRRVDERTPAAEWLMKQGWIVGALIEPMLSPVDLPPLPWSWIICGPENGKGKRKFDGMWALRLAQQAKAAGVPFFFKAGALNGKRYIETP